MLALNQLSEDEVKQKPNKDKGTICHSYYVLI